MPTYEYICKGCGHQFEVFQQMSAAPLTVCPECDGEVKRLIGTGAGFIMKGGSRRNAPLECGRDRPCCGREERCDQPGCEM